MIIDSRKGNTLRHKFNLQEHLGRTCYFHFLRTRDWLNAQLHLEWESSHIYLVRITLFEVISFTRHLHNYRGLYKRAASLLPRQLQFVCMTQFCAIRSTSFSHSIFLGLPNLNDLRRARLQFNTLLSISTLLIPNTPGLTC